MFHPALLGWCFAVDHPALLPTPLNAELVQESGAPEGGKPGSAGRSTVEQGAVKASFSGRSSADVFRSKPKKRAKEDGSADMEQPQPSGAPQPSP